MQLSWRRPEPAPAPETPERYAGWWSAEQRRLRLFEETCGGEPVGRPAAEVPAASPVTEPSPAPVTRNLGGTWSVHTPMSVHYRNIAGYNADRRAEQRDLERRTPPIYLRKDGSLFRRGSWNRWKSPPLLD